MNIKSRRWALALATVSASIAVSGIGAGGAQAALTGQCLGDSIHAGGSSLQFTAQTIWSLGGTFGTGTTTGFNTSASGCNGANKPAVRYTSTSSGQCLSAFGASDSVFKSATNTAFCGTDDAPTTAEIGNINAATSAQTLSIPIAQTSIAIIASAPHNCTVTATTKEQVEMAFRTTTSWTAFGGIPHSGFPTACNAHITKVVRNDSSGTTYQLKHWLSTINPSSFDGGTTWTGLQAAATNQTWPGSFDRSQRNCGSVMQLPCSGGANSGSGGGDEAKTVATAGNSLGYAALPDARSVTAATGSTFPTYRWVKIKGSLGATLDPSSNGQSAARARSNCATSGAGIYKNTAGSLPTATQTWSDVYYASSNNYPVCTLTFDLALSHYERSATFGATGTRIGTTVRDYLHYILTGGQAEALGTNNDYSILPDDVRIAGTTGLSDITG